jgi:C4-dicarboxylate-specific signal transduction histidine kinase
MKNRIIATTLLLCMPLAGFTSDTDSLVIKDLEYLKKRVNLLIYQLNQLEEMTTEDLDSLNALSSASMEQLNRIRSQSANHQQELKDSLNKQTHRMRGFFAGLQTTLQKTSKRDILFYASAMALILLLLILFLRERRRSIDHLMARAKKIANQNDEILHKTDELQNIRSDVEKTILQQKKMKKKIKKIRKG